MAESGDENLSRRAFLGAMAAAPATARSVLGTGMRRVSASSKPRIVVVGAGAFGGWSALQLLRGGAEVTLLDAWGAGNPRASSGGEGRAIRGIYGPDRIYSEWVHRSFELWNALERDSRETVYIPTGALWMIPGDDTYVRRSLPILAELGMRVESPSLAEAPQRWPQIDFEGIRSVYLEEQAGVLLARHACQVVRDRVVSEGGDWRIGRAVTTGIGDGPLARLRLGDGTELAADQFLFACGPWLGALFPELIGDGIRPSRQEVHYFGPPAGSEDWRGDRLPIWIDFDETLWYGFPDVHGRGFKIADDTRGVGIDPSTAERSPTAGKVAAARRFLARRFPALADAPLVESRVCQYENSPDGHLVLDCHPDAPNVWIAGGGSGHGFKLSPAVGEHMAGRILRAEPAEPRFSLARLAAATPLTTQFDNR